MAVNCAGCVHSMQASNDGHCDHLQVAKEQIDQCLMFSAAKAPITPAPEAERPMYLWLRETHQNHNVRPH